MTWDFSLQSYILVSSAILGSLSAALIWRRRLMPGGTVFIWCMLATTLWALLDAFEKAAVEVPTKVFFAKLEYLGIATVPVLWFLFALEYSQNNKWLIRRNVLLLWIIPIITIVLVFTNELHGLIWSRILSPAESTSGHIVYQHGLFFWIAASYNYLLLLSGTVALIWLIYRSPVIFRYQAASVIAGLAVPWISNVMYLLGASPIPGSDPTPFAFVITGLIYSLTIFRLKLFDLVPIARHALVELMSDGIVVLDTDNRIVDINPSAQRILALGSNLLVGSNAAGMFPGWERLADPAANAHLEISVGGEGGRYYDVRIAPLLSTNDLQVGKMIVMRDITERRQLEKFRDDLMYTIVHDLRGPLTSVNMALEMLIDDVTITTSPEHQELLDVLTFSSKHMLSLVNSILDINRLESGQMMIERKRFDLDKLVKQMIQVQAALAESRRIKVVNRIGSELPPVLADEALIGRVVQNLLNNAIKFTPPGGHIEISGQPGADRITVSITDTGTGIPADLEGKLFQKFATGHLEGSGTGLGLAFCRLTIEVHGGRIWVENNGDQGTKFSFTLPLN